MQSDAMQATDTTKSQPPATAGPGGGRIGWRRFLRFSLRGLLLLVLLVSVWLGWQVNRAHKQRRAIAKIQELGGSVIFDYQVIESRYHESALHWNPKNEPAAAPWLRDLVGEEYFREVIAVDLDETPTRDEDLWILDDLPRVEFLWLGKTQVTDHALERIAYALPELKGLGCFEAKLSDQGLAPLGVLRNLHQLNLWNVPIGDDGIRHLAPLAKMRQLTLDGTLVSDKGLVHLANMHEIDEWLGLYGTQVTDDGLKHLAHMKKARNINLLKSRVSGKGGTWLSEQLPKCHVSFEW
jgi:hypothetical protein